jgi:hypothetical protein
MIERFPFGEYNGKSAAYVALTDYQYLGWIRQQGIKSPALRRSAEYVRNALNCFCTDKLCTTCKAPAKNLSFARGDGRWLVEDAYLFCEKKDCWTATGLDGPQIIKPIAFDTMLEFPCQPKYARDGFQDLLNRCVGFEGRRTNERCDAFIDDLTRKNAARLTPRPAPSGPSLF